MPSKSLAPLSCFVACCALAAGAPFPLGIYGVRSTNDFPALREAGFNLVVGPAEKSYLDAAQSSGLKVLASFSAGANRRTLARLDRHPALWAWYLSDEPDQHLIPP